jgi:hypothetical protein
MTFSVLLITMTGASSLRANADFDPSRLKAIIAAFEEREDAGEGDRTTKVHIAWLKTPQGKADVAYLN